MPLMTFSMSWSMVAFAASEMRLWPVRKSATDPSPSGSIRSDTAKAAISAG